MSGEEWLRVAGLRKAREFLDAAIRKERAMYSMENMQVTVEVEKILKILRENRKKHRKIVEEARKGYIEQAKLALEARMNQLLRKAKVGKTVGLSFSMHPPQDHTAAYDTLIGMLEMHTAPQIVLSAGQYRNFVEDKWDWSDSFYASNSAYSATAATFYNDEEDDDE